MPPFDIVVGSGLVLIEVVPMERWKVSIDPGGREVVKFASLYAEKLTTQNLSCLPLMGHTMFTQSLSEIF